MHHHEALSVRDDLGRIQSLLQVLKELLLVSLELVRAADKLQNLRRAGTLALQGRQAAGEHGLGNQGDGHSQVKRIDGGPLAGTLLSSGVEDLLKERGSVIVIIVHDIAGDLDEERVEDALVPLCENITNLLVWHAETALHDVVGLSSVSPGSSMVRGARSYLADQLHVTVLNTVVDHLDIVAGTLITNPLAAWVAIALGGDGLEDVLDVRPSLLVSSGHYRGSISGTLLTSGHSAADEPDALGGQVFRAAVGVGEMRVATIDDDVALLDVGEEGLNEVVDGLAGHDEEHHAAGFLELADEVLDGVGALDGFSCGDLDQSSGGQRLSSTGGGVPLASFARKWSTLDTVRLKATTLKPWSAALRIRFWPMTAKPIRPKSPLATRLASRDGDGDADEVAGSASVRAGPPTLMPARRWLEEREESGQEEFLEGDGCWRANYRREAAKPRRKREAGRPIRTGGAGDGDVEGRWWGISGAEENWQLTSVRS